MNNRIIKTMGVVAALAANLCLTACGSEPVESAQQADEARAAQLAAHEDAADFFATHSEQLIAKGDTNCTSSGIVEVRCDFAENRNCYVYGRDLMVKCQF